MSNSTDSQLLRSFVEQRHEPAFAELVERHVDLVYSAALRQVAGDAHRAQDVTQSVFCELARKAPALLDRPSLAGWLYTTARHIASRTQRGELRRVRHELACHAMSDASPDPATVDAWESLRPVLDDAMHSLPVRDREAVLLRYFQNRSYREVGTALGLRENAARMRVERALERLRRQLERRGITSTAAVLAGVLSTQPVAAAPAGVAASVLSAVTSRMASGALNISWSARLLSWMGTGKAWLATGGAVALFTATTPTLRSHEQMTAVRVRFEEPAGGPMASATPTMTTATPGWQWASIESTDYRQYIANLRASGAPEQLIRDLVALELQRHFTPSYAAARSVGKNTLYWQKQAYPALSEEQEKQLARIEREHHAVLRELFGPSARLNDAINILFTQPDGALIQLAWLPPEKAMKAAAVIDELASADSGRTGASGARSSHTNPRAELKRELAALSDVLSPEELEEYRLRKDVEVSLLRSQTRLCNLTESDFRELLKIKDRNQKLFRLIGSYQDQEECLAAIARVLPAEKAQEFIRSIDLTYTYALEVANHLQLPPETADRVWQIKCDAMIAAHQIRQKRSQASEAAVARQLSEVADQAERQIRGLVGDDGFLSLRRDWPWWKNLRSP